jgi:putative membrane protein
MPMLALAQAGLLAVLASGPPGPSRRTRGCAKNRSTTPRSSPSSTPQTPTIIESSDLAAKQAAHPDVRELGQKFAHDHAAVRQQGRDLAKKLGVKPTPSKDDKSARNHAEAMRKLKATAKGDDFDQAYLAHEVAYHKAVIDAINQTLLPAIKNPELKAFVQRVAPAFQRHLAAAQKLAEKYGAVAHTSP